MEIKPINIDGIEYYNVQQFATICNKGASQVYILVRKGLIKADILMNQTMIPTSELSKASSLFPRKRHLHFREDAIKDYGGEM